MALFDFEAQKPTHLSLKKNDVIQIADAAG
jgi:hypothetical protein